MIPPSYPRHQSESITTHNVLVVAEQLYYLTDPPPSVPQSHSRRELIFANIKIIIKNVYVTTSLTRCTYLNI